MKNLKVLIILSLVLVMALPLLACKKDTEMPSSSQTNEVQEQITEESTDSDADIKEADEEEMTELTLTLDELKMYDGTNGSLAYIAYDGVIYDVTNDPNWSSGSHGGNMAGTDITEKLNNVSHGTSKLNTLKVVGKIID